MTIENTAQQREVIREFRIEIPQSELDSLKQRLRDVRWPEEEPVHDWTQGVPLAKAKALIDYWRDHYDWRRIEARLNFFPQFLTEIDGLDIHFHHIRSPHAEALPMIMTHGWPGSTIEFLKVIEPLTNPTKFGGSASDAFHLVIPSLPGHGFSGKPREAGWNAEHTAKAWAVLMQRLGYSRYVAQGGDWGSTVTHFMASQRPKGLLAGHVCWPLVFPATMPTDLTPEEAKAFDAVERFKTDAAGYHHQQATRPQTLGYALADSPAGQAIWIYEKFNEWTDNNGTIEELFTLDEMLDNISIYWLTNSGGSSARYYWENARGTTGTNLAFGRIELPMSATIFPKDMYEAPRHWAEASWPNLVHWGISEKGGHFSAWEQPEIIVGEVRKAFQCFR
ncbi:epoxide hydrolase [Paraburkholderia phytofirmans OLGA172]|uniref:Epoxide hydrolase n=1 Tax=Paraburkholderia phytofirmans OLGA172 TaxID=1417228 RepID=A0A160FS53_9BURK|nr:epoxide hydrolase family protein [Paraburkholderia phytofirmans]ANB75890.1 epoxide hydrolase [Paraburkholderia phytofirmans OLGA172]